MFKMVGAILIIIGSGITGLIIARNYSLRPQQIRYLRNGMQMLETEILYGLTPLPEALRRIGQRLPFPIGQFYLRTSELLTHGEGLPAFEAWEIALRDLQDNSALLAEDLDILYYFGQSLGGSDRQEQEKNLRLVLEQLRQLEIKAEELKVKNKKLWQYLGFSLGAVVVLILI